MTEEARGKPSWKLKPTRPIHFEFVAQTYWSTIIFPLFLLIATTWRYPSCSATLKKYKISPLYPSCISFTASFAKVNQRPDPQGRHKYGLYISIYIYICRSIYLSIYLSICMYTPPQKKNSRHSEDNFVINMSISVSTSMSMFLSIYLPTFKQLCVYRIPINYPHISPLEVTKRNDIHTIKQ